LAKLPNSYSGILFPFTRKPFGNGFIIPGWPKTTFLLRLGLYLQTSPIYSNSLEGSLKAKGRPNLILLHLARNFGTLRKFYTELGFLQPTGLWGNLAPNFLNFLIYVPKNFFFLKLKGSSNIRWPLIGSFSLNTQGTAWEFTQRNQGNPLKLLYSSKKHSFLTSFFFPTIFLKGCKT